MCGAKLDAAVGAGCAQLLRVGVGDDELDALQVERDHVVDGIGAAAADADHGDPGREIGVVSVADGQVQGHVRSPSSVGPKAVLARLA